MRRTPVKKCLTSKCELIRGWDDLSQSLTGRYIHVGIRATFLYFINVLFMRINPPHMASKDYMTLFSKLVLYLQ